MDSVYYDSYFFVIWRKEVALLNVLILYGSCKSKVCAD